MHASEDVGERGAADTLMCGATSGHARSASAAGAAGDADGGSGCGLARRRCAGTYSYTSDIVCWKRFLPTNILDCYSSTVRTMPYET